MASQIHSSHTTQLITWYDAIFSVATTFAERKDFRQDFRTKNLPRAHYCDKKQKNATTRCIIWLADPLCSIYWLQTCLESYLSLNEFLYKTRDSLCYISRPVNDVFDTYIFSLNYRIYLFSSFITGIWETFLGVSPNNTDIFETYWLVLKKTPQRRLQDVSRVYMVWTLYGRWNYVVSDS